jgi:hypothetical protein
MSDISHQARAILHAAAFEPRKRSALVAELQADPGFRAAAQQELARLAEGQRLGRLLDRDHISKMTHDMLVSVLAQVAASTTGVSVTAASGETR